LNGLSGDAALARYPTEGQIDNLETLRDQLKNGVLFAEANAAPIVEERRPHVEANIYSYANSPRLKISAGLTKADDGVPLNDEAAIAVPHPVGPSALSAHPAAQATLLSYSPAAYLLPAPATYANLLTPAPYNQFFPYAHSNFWVVTWGLDKPFRALEWEREQINYKRTEARMLAANPPSPFVCKFPSQRNYYVRHGKVPTRGLSAAQIAGVAQDGLHFRVKADIMRQRVAQFGP